MDGSEHFCPGAEPNKIIGQHDMFAPRRPAQAHLEDAQIVRVLICPSSRPDYHDRRTERRRCHFETIFSYRGSAGIFIFRLIRRRYPIRIAACPKILHLLRCPPFYLMGQIPAIKMSARLRNLKRLFPSMDTQRIFRLPHYETDNGSQHNSHR